MATISPAPFPESGQRKLSAREAMQRAKAAGSCFPGISGPKKSGRSGRLNQKIFAATKVLNDQPLPPLSFEDQQFSSLMQAAEADLIFNMLRESSPEIIPQTMPSDIYQRLSNLLDAGREQGIVDAPDQLQFVAIAWSSSETIYQLPCLVTSWEMTRSENGRFSEVLTTWNDSIWEQIDALSPATDRENA